MFGRLQLNALSRNERRPVIRVGMGAVFGPKRTTGGAMCGGAVLPVGEPSAMEEREVASRRENVSPTRRRRGWCSLLRALPRRSPAPRVRLSLSDADEAGAQA